MRIVVDLDETQIGHRYKNGRLMAQLRPGITDFILTLKRADHTLVLWTAASHEWVRQLARMYPGLFAQFDEVYTRETLPPVDHRGRYWKDIRRIGGDVLIDDDADFKRIAESEGIGRRYIHVPPYRPGQDAGTSLRHLGQALRQIDRLARTG